MASFSASLTDPPSLDSDDPGGTAVGWVAYTIIAGLAFVALAIARATIAPLVGNTIEDVTGVQLTEDDSDDLVVV